MVAIIRAVPNAVPTNRKPVQASDLVFLRPFGSYGVTHRSSPTLLSRGIFVAVLFADVTSDATNALAAPGNTNDKRLWNRE